MRALLAIEIFVEVGEAVYSHNGLSKKFADKSFQNFYAVMCVPLVEE